MSSNEATTIAVEHQEVKNSLINEERSPNEQKSPNNNKNSILHDLIFIVITCVIGFCFGFLLEKCKVYEPKFIRQQMIFNKFLMMKMFFSALAASMLSILFLNLISKKKYLKVFESYRDMLKPKSLLIVSAGGLILGLGMTIAGSCPGMIFVQLGAGVNYSYLTLIGGLLGALVHGLLNSYLTKSSQPDPITSKTIFEVIRINHFVVRIIFIVLLYGGVTLMEILVPWKNDYIFRNDSNSSFSLTSEVWHPIIAGSLLGFLQFFSIFFLSKSLGSSSCFTTAVSLIFSFKCLEKFPYLKKFRFGLVNYSILLFVLFTFGGSMSSAFLGGVFNKTTPVNPFDAVLGGFLLVFGARLAGGCNTGHGISGTSHLFIGSIIAMMSMFASGILLGFYAFTNDFFL